MSSHADVTVFVQGLRQWQGLLRSLPVEVRKDVTREIETAVEPLVRRAEEKAPRSDKNKRHLAESIRVMLRARGALVGSVEPWAAVVHFARRITQRSAAGTPYTRSFTPTPWLYPAADETKDEVIERLRPAVERAIARTESAVFG